MASSFFKTALGLLGAFAGLGSNGQPNYVAPQPARAPAVAAPIVASAASNLTGTIVLIHGGGWAGPNAAAEQALVDQPGRLFLDRRWRIVSVDYHEGTSGLEDVLAVVRDELARPSGRTLCLYGESAGGELALIAAAREPRVNCVIAAGAPTDFTSYAAEARAGGDALHLMVVDKLNATFGSDGSQWSSWEPVRVADQIEADVLLMRQADDPLIPAQQVQLFRDARATTQTVELESGNPDDPADYWLHGTLSQAGRGQYLSALGAFAKQATANRKTARAAARLRCRNANARLGVINSAQLWTALRCLVRHDRALRGRDRRSGHAVRVRVRGSITAARVWVELRRTTSGRRALRSLSRGRGTASVRAASRSTVTVRPTR